LGLPKAGEPVGRGGGNLRWGDLLSLELEVRLIYTFLPGISWNVLEDSMDFQEFPSHSMGFHVPNYVILHSLSRTFHRTPYCSILFHDLPQGSMEFPDIPGDSILFHWIL
jgi:hypothetical protein